MKKEHLKLALIFTALISFMMFVSLEHDEEFWTLMAAIVPATFVISLVTIIALEAVDKAKRNVAAVNEAQRMYSKNKSEPKKDASVVGRAVAGGIVAGPAGAVVGALSAVDKNNKNLIT